MNLDDDLMQPGLRRSAARLAVLAAAFVMISLAGCGGSAGGGSSSSGGTSSSGGSSSGGTGGLQVTLTVLDQNGAAITTLPAGQSATAVAKVTNNGAVVSGALVTFTPGVSGGAVLINVSSPLSGTVVTDATGTAQATIIPSGNGAGGTTLTASANFNSTTASASNSFNVGQTSTTGLTISSFTAVGGGASATINSYGTTGLVATVTTSTGAVPTSPTTVNFAISGSPCGSGGSATVTPSSNTSLVNGAMVAQATFSDNGCARNSTVTVAVSASLTSSTPPLPTMNVTVKVPTSGSLQFVSSNPSGTAITLKGQGGNGRVSSATLTFALVDLNNKPIANFPVCFDATTYAGGLTVDGFNNLTPPTGLQLGTAATCGSDNTLFYLKNSDANGQIQIQVNSGTQPTPVRVRARTSYPLGTTPLLETLSDLLVISTGLPVDRNMDLSVDVANIEGRDYSGEVATFTVRLADLFGNPVPTGTQVNFVTSGGSICTATQGACTTDSTGSCQCKLTTQAYRPIDGRVVVMAYAIGLPDFVDVNNNFQFDAGDYFYPLGDAFLDANKNDVYDPGGTSLSITNGDIDQCFPYVLTSPPKCISNPDNHPATTSSTTGFGPVYLRRSLVVFFSGGSGDLPTARLPYASQGTAPNKVAVIPTTACANGVVTIPFALNDGYGNPLPHSATVPGDTTVSALPIGTVSLTGGGIIGVYPPHVPQGPLNAINYDYPNVPKTSTTIADPQVFSTGASLTVTTGSCAAGASGSGQITVSSPRGPKNVTTCVLYEGEALGTCPRTGFSFVLQ